MMSRSNDLGALFTGVMFALFVFSGMLKWIPLWPTDPTLLFGAISAAIIVKNLITKHLIISRLVVYPILFTSMFFAWYLLSATYSLSTIFWDRKALVLLLSSFAFFFPLVCFRSLSHFKYFKLSVLSMAFIAAAVVLFFYFAGTLDYLFPQGSDKENFKFPDYLNLAVLMCLGVLLSLEDFKILNMVYLGVVVLGLLTLESRGPALFLFLCVLASIFLFRHAKVVSLSKNHSVCMYTSDNILSAGLRKANWTRLKGVNSAASTRQHDKRKQKWRVLITLLMAVFFIAVAFYWEGAGPFITRFTATFRESEEFKKAIRFDEFLVAAEVISKHPFLGVGLGGYGVAGYGIDENVYPHNILIEALAEAGIPGVVLLTIALMTTFVMSINRLKDKQAAVYYLLALFLLLNYMKSGGFVGTRDLFAFIGTLLAYLNQQSRFGTR